MRKLKSKRLNKPKKIIEAGLERAADTLLSRIRQKPEPRMNWNEIRKAKVALCHNCLNFNPLLGGCKLNLIPHEKCEKKRLDKELRL